MIKFSKESGKIEKKQMIIASVIACVGIVAVVLIINVTKPAPPPVIEVEKEPEPVYEVKLGEKVRFKLQEVKDRGDVLELEENKNPNFVKQDVTTTERFIEVTVAVDNIGKDNIPAGSWDVREVYDKEGRKFYSSTLLNYWTSSDGECGDLLKPGFSPILCTKIYEVARVSTGLKAEVFIKEDKATAYIDLGL